MEIEFPEKKIFNLRRVRVVVVVAWQTLLRIKLVPRRSLGAKGANAKEREELIYAREAQVCEGKIGESKI